VLKGGMVMLTPLENYVVLTVEKEESKTASGIILTTENKDKPAFGKVFATGPKVEGLSVNDVVVYQTYSGTSVKVQGQDFLLIKAENILAKVTK
jgi:chaperonin GroES